MTNLRAALDDVIRMTTPGYDVPADAFTIGDYLARISELGQPCGPSTAERRLKAFVGAGVLASALVLRNGKQVRVYWRVPAD